MKLISLRRNVRRGCAAGVTIGALLTAAPAAPAADGILATVGGESITRAYLAEAERLLGPAGANRGPKVLLNHLADRKALAMLSFADASVAERESAAVRIRADEGKGLVALYRAVEVEGKVPPVSAAEVEAAAPRLKLYDLSQYTFREPEKAREFLAKHRANPEVFSMHYTNLHYKAQTLAERYFADQAAGLRGLKAGDYSEPLRWGKEFTAVFKADAVRDEDDTALAKRRAELRAAMSQRRTQSRFNEVLTGLIARYSYRETEAVALIRSKGIRISGLDDDAVLATRDGASYTGADLKRELDAYKSRTPHGAMESATVVRIFREAVERDLFAAAARAAGLDRTPEFAAYRALSADLVWSNDFADRVRRDAGTPTPEEVKVFYGAKRGSYPGDFESERPAAQRALTAERVTKLAAERMEAARRRFPVTIIAVP